jgi:hypothetical protein
MRLTGMVKLAIHWVNGQLLTHKYHLRTMETSPDPSPPNHLRPSLHCKKRLTIFHSPAGMSLTKLSLAGNNLIIPGLREFG